MKDADGKWTRSIHQQVVTSYDFAIDNYHTPGPNVVAMEYFFDQDPGQGAGNTLSITPDADALFMDSIDVSGLSFGAHFLHVRAQDADGHWTAMQTEQLVKDPGNVFSNYNSPGSDIVAIEYFFNEDPGFGQGNMMTFSSDQNVVLVDSACTFGLDSGSHVMHVRAQDADGLWSHMQTDTLHVFGPCSVVLTIDQNPIGDGIIQGCIIESAGSVPGSGDVTFSAGNAIELDVGFEVELGGLFEALIKLCFVPSP